MKIIDFFNLIKGFTKEDFQEFKKFLISPYLVNIESLIKIFKEIEDNKHLLFKSEYDKLLKKLSRKLKYSDSTIIQRLSALNKAVLKYFKIKSLLNDKVLSEFSLNEYLFSKNYMSLLGYNLKHTHKIILNSNKFSDKSFLNSFGYNVQMCDFITYNSRFVNNKSAELLSSHIKSAFLDLTLYSLIQKINLYTCNVSLNVLKGKRRALFSPIYIKNILEEVDKYHLSHIPLREKIIYNLYKSLFLTFYESNKVDNYLKYKICIKNALKYLTKEIINFHYDQIINYCAMKARLGEDKDYFLRQQLEVLKYFIKNDYFKINGDEYLHSTVYRNFIISAYSMNDFKLLKHFIDTASTKLNTKDYNDMWNLGLTYYYYGIKNYKKALGSIKNIKNNNFIYRFDIRNFVLRIYYESGDYNKSLETLHNYKIIISNDTTLNKPMKDSLEKELKYLNKLISLRTNLKLNVQKEANFLINKIQKEPTFALKNWLLEMLNKFSKTKKEKVLIL